MTVKILLLQARHADDDARLEEHSSFANMAGVADTQVIPYGLLASTPSLADVRRYDALMVGGSGDYYVSKGNLPNFQAVLGLLADVVAVGQPMFASCFGFQLLVSALGGEIVYDAHHAEVGTYDVTLTENGRSDDLFNFLPDTFRAQLGRKDRASRLPDGVLHLASSENAPFQALCVPGKPIWATQFHPELTKATNLARFKRYMTGYASIMDEVEVEKTLARFDESPEANQLIGRFMQLVFG
ncbi:MAG: type 1 glutamine amidotransferase [Ardenticatenaceae bacterium]|nr:type 1 glutamine amidotransferase [Ardenticatenaceae bacterium]